MMGFRKLDYDLVINLYRAGYTTKEIGAMLGCVHGTISKVLKKRNEPTRERGVIIPKAPLNKVFVDSFERGEVMTHMMAIGMSDKAVANAFQITDEQLIVSLAEYNVNKRRGETKTARDLVSVSLEHVL